MLTHRRSRGVLVPISVARLIRTANAARSRGDWPAAVAAFKQALAAAPHLGHIWIQLGHALKESGRPDDAAAAYTRAAAIGSEGAEPHLHLGRVARLVGDLPRAGRYYFDALREEPGNLGAAAELMRCVDAREPDGARMVEKVAAAHGLTPPQPRSDIHCAEDTQRVFLDVTDLLSYFAHARLPTGIQRVQIELVSAILREGVRGIHACCYAEGRCGWTALDGTQFLALADIALASDNREDEVWCRSVITLMLGVATDPPIAFADGDTLLNVGSSWSERNYFLHLRTARATAKLAYVALVYDLIPTFAPHWFPASLVDDYIGWLATVVDHADGYIAISQATRGDLQRQPGLDAPIAVLPLNADFRSRSHPGDPGPLLARHGLHPGGFILMVSTIEPRKNHIGALTAWLELVETLGEAAVPKLICVGGRGWMNDHVHAKIAAHPVLRRKILLLHGVPDAELDVLYRNCLLTLYPSFYEGWGLPVTESLCYGKIPVVSGTSSLPEAGGRLAVYFDPDTPGSLSGALTPLLVDPDERARREHEIEAAFVPRSWAELGRSMLKQTVGINPLHVAPPLLASDVRYHLKAGRIEGRRNGEIFRAGTGWQSPTTLGTGIRNSRARFRFVLEAGDEPSRFVLRATNFGQAASKVEVTVAGYSAARAEIMPGDAHWISITLPPRQQVIESTVICLGDPSTRRLYFTDLTVTSTAETPDVQDRT